MNYLRGWYPHHLLFQLSKNSSCWLLQLAGLPKSKRSREINLIWMNGCWIVMGGHIHNYTNIAHKNNFKKPGTKQPIPSKVQSYLKMNVHICTYKWILQHNIWHLYSTHYTYALFSKFDVKIQLLLYRIYVVILIYKKTQNSVIWSSFDSGKAAKWQN